MKLLVNISSIGKRPTGLGTYALRCATAAAAALDAEVVAASGVSGFDNVVLRAPVSHTLGASRAAPLKRWVWSKLQREFPGRLMYSPTHHGLCRGEAQVLTVHDLIALRFPLQHKVQYLYFRHVLPRELARCRAVFTVSETTRQDIHDTYRVPLDRIRVVPNGVDRTLFRPDALGVTREGVAEPYLLVVGASFSHKNIEELLAHAHCWRERFRLVIVSSRGHYRQVLEQAVTSARLRDRVRFIDYAAQADLIRLYQRCAAFVYPSRWEGFGIPPLEALACGAPVIVSDIPAHREVLGDHATFVRLGDAADWERAFAALERMPAHSLLGRHTTSPLDRFTWERSAQRLVEHLLETEPRLHRRLRQPQAAYVA